MKRGLFLWLMLLPLAYGMTGDELTRRWSTTVEVLEKHAGYARGGSISEPKATWQTLFAVVAVGKREGELQRYCVHLYIGEKDHPGTLRVTAKGTGPSCQARWDMPALFEDKHVREVSVEYSPGGVRVNWTSEGGRPHSLKTAKADRDGIFFFSQEESISSLIVKEELVGTLAATYPLFPCNFVDGSCQHCRWGVYQVVGDGFHCGVDRCGERNEPACPRGTRWSGKRGPFSCRGDQSHMFCASQFRVECVGETGVCR